MSEGFRNTKWKPDVGGIGFLGAKGRMGALVVNGRIFSHRQFRRTYGEHIKVKSIIASLEARQYRNLLSDFCYSSKRTPFTRNLIHIFSLA